MWLLTINGLVYLAYGVITGRLRERLLPIRLSDLVHTVRDTLHFKIAHEDLTTYNAVQKLLYIIVILAGIAQVVIGLRSGSRCNSQVWYRCWAASSPPASSTFSAWQ
jgi:thiosulfate reductase cytochrome b subunit